MNLIINIYKIKIINEKINKQIYIFYIKNRKRYVLTGTWQPRWACCKCVCECVWAAWRNGEVKAADVYNKTQTGSSHDAVWRLSDQLWSPQPHTGSHCPCSAATEEQNTNILHWQSLKPSTTEVAAFVWLKKKTNTVKTVILWNIITI